MIDSSHILAFGKDLKSDIELRILAFSYAVYTDILIEIIFNSIYSTWTEYDRLRTQFSSSSACKKHLFPEAPSEIRARFESIWNESIMEDYFKLMINDLKRIISERKKLISACGFDENFNFLLSVPLSFARHQELESALSSSLQGPTPYSVSSPFELATLFWMHVMKDYEDKEEEFPIKTCSARQIFECFFQFRGSFETGRFCSSLYTSNFFDLILDNNPKIEEDAHFYSTNLLIISSPFIENFGNLQQLDGDKKSNLKLYYENVLGYTRKVFHLYNLISEDEGNMENYMNFVYTKRGLENALFSNFRPHQIPGLMQYALLDPSFASVFSLFPELFGVSNLRFLASHKLLPRDMINHLSPLMISKLLDVLEFENLDGLRRGLVALPASEIEKYLVVKNFRLDDPVNFAQCSCKDELFKAFGDTSETGNQIRLFQMLTPFIIELGTSGSLDLYQLPESVESFFLATRNVKIVSRAILQWSIMNEVNFIKFSFNAPQIEAHSAFEAALFNFLSAENEIRMHFSGILQEAIGIDKAHNETISALTNLLKYQGLSPSRAGFVKRFRSHLQFKDLFDKSLLPETLERNLLETLIEKLIDNEDDRLELILVTHLLVLGTPEQLQLRSHVFVQALQGHQVISKSILKLVEQLTAHNHLLLDSEFVRIDPAFEKSKLMETLSTVLP